jgi:hypothetical protein
LKILEIAPNHKNANLLMKKINWKRKRIDHHF